MATAKKVSTVASPAKKVAKPAAKVAVKMPAVKAEKPVLKPIKQTFNKTSLVAHLAATTGVDAKAVKSVMAALEATMLASVQKKGAGEFTLPGLVRLTAQNIPAKKARKGINPFTKEETVFKAKPATIKLKARFFKKLKDAAL